MRFAPLFFAGLLVLFSNSVTADAADPQLINREVSDFFDEYLSVYNRRFGKPERSEQFRREIGELVTFPLLQAPPVGQPRVPENLDAFARGFESFVSSLEKKSVQRLVWESVEFEILTPNKVLANNIGVGLTADGAVAYETVSLYLLYRTENGWKIVMFSPYDRNNTLQLSRR
ncbi:MAG: hypothetical protein AAGA23_11035 [Pseudomonadota bacterium]